jgi:hypothetical protein
VTRIEHENLYSQVMENVRALRRIEAEVAAIHFHPRPKTKRFMTQQ